jgi:hypothetical protein
VLLTMRADAMQEKPTLMLSDARDRLREPARRVSTASALVKPVSKDLASRGSGVYP